MEMIVFSARILHMGISARGNVNANRTCATLKLDAQPWVKISEISIITRVLYSDFIFQLKYCFQHVLDILLFYSILIEKSFVEKLYLT